MEGGEKRERKQKMRKIKRQRVDPEGKMQQVETQKTMRKKKKKQWINLRDKSQRWNHEKKLRDIRASALFKKQRRREMHSGEHSECGEAHSTTNFERDQEEGGGKKGRMNLSPAQAAGVANDHGYYASDPEDFLERLLNPFHSERKREKREAAASKTGSAAAFAQRKEPEGRRRRRRRDAAAGRTAAGKTAVEGDEDDPRRETPQVEACAAEGEGKTYMHEKNARKRSFRATSKEISTWASDNRVGQGEKDQNKEEETEGECGDEEEEEEEEGEAAAHPEKDAGMEGSERNYSHLGEEQSTRPRGRRSRRLALYSPHSSATLEDFPAVSRGKKKRRRATEGSRPESKHRKNSVLQEATSRYAIAVEKKSASEESAAVDTRETRGTVVETRRENGADEKRNLGADGKSVDRSTKAHSKELQVSLPKGVFYPFQHAMREAARRKAAQEEEKKRRQEEREKAEKEKEYSRRRRAKQRRQLVARTSRGQPVMNNVVQVLLQKIKKSV